MISPTLCEKKAVYIPKASCGCEFYMIKVDENDTTNIYNLYGSDGVVATNIQVPKAMCDRNEITVPVLEG